MSVEPEQSNEHLGTIVCAGVRRTIAGQHVLCLALSLDDGRVVADRFCLRPPDAELDRLGVLGRATNLDGLADTLPPDTLQLIGKRVIVVFDEESDEYRPPLGYRRPVPGDSGSNWAGKRVVACRTCIEAWLAHGPVGP